MISPGGKKRRGGGGIYHISHATRGGGREMIQKKRKDRPGQVGKGKKEESGNVMRKKNRRPRPWYTRKKGEKVFSTKIDGGDEEEKNEATLNSVRMEGKEEKMNAIFCFGRKEGEPRAAHGKERGKASSCEPTKQKGGEKGEREPSLRHRRPKGDGKREL